MDFNTIIPFILPVTSGLALIISIFSIGYTYYQNRRKIEVDIWIEYENQLVVNLCVFNPGYRSVALIKSKFLVNNEYIEIEEGGHDVDRLKFGSKAPGSYWISPTKKVNFPYGLKEGDAVFYGLSARQLAYFLHYNGYSGIVKLSGYFKTAQKKIVKSKSIDFDIERYKNVKGIDNSPPFRINLTEK
jgi:hypothetical protein